MAVFAVIPLAHNLPLLTERVQRRFPEGERYLMPNAAGWLVSHKGTSVDLCNLLEITGQPEGVRSPVGSALVAPITSYYGRAPTDMWEWIKVKMEAAQ